MNAFDEFIGIAQSLDAGKIPYAVVGGVALAFHGHARFTQDIDLLVPPSDLAALTAVLADHGYTSFTKPWPLGHSGLVLHRFLKPGSGSEMILDILEAQDPPLQAMIENALTAEGPEGRVKVARSEDLITLKRMRNSIQDQADITRLTDEKS